MYPAMLNLTGRKITIIGGGRVAYRKAKAFLNFGAKVYVFAPRLYEAFKNIEDQIIKQEVYIEQQDLAYIVENSFIVVAATDSRTLNEQIGEHCEKSGILCNVIDAIHLSSFIVPAYMRRGDLIISVSTNGKSPSLAKKIKKELEATYDSSYEEYVAILGRIRDYVLQEVKDDKKKQRILQYVTTLNLEELKNYEKSHFSY